MTLEEARNIAKIFEQADDGCRICVAEMASIADCKFPEFTWVFDGDSKINVEIRVQKEEKPA